ncbi:hypothetical protein BLA18110_07986 [Burkholderia lata]|nr:hypothetical protein BLA18110_07986 [Burkholderia lata]
MPGCAVPTIVGRGSSVTPSGLMLPVRSPALSITFTIDGAAGLPPVISEKSNGSLGSLTLPAASVAFTVNECGPFSSVSVTISQFPSASAYVLPTTRSPSYNVTSACGSATPRTVGFASSVTSPGFSGPV